MERKCGLKIKCEACTSLVYKYHKTIHVYFAFIVKEQRINAAKKTAMLSLSP
jgi:hypothetical protein